MPKHRKPQTRRPVGRLPQSQIPHLWRRLFVRIGLIIGGFAALAIIAHEGLNAEQAIGVLFGIMLLIWVLANCKRVARKLREHVKTEIRATIALYAPMFALMQAAMDRAARRAGVATE